LVLLTNLDDILVKKNYIKLKPTNHSLKILLKPMIFRSSRSS